MSGHRIASRHKTRVTSKTEWVCVGCGRERPAGSTRITVFEGSKVAASLCVFCLVDVDSAMATMSEEEYLAKYADPDDPFVTPRDAEIVWNEVFGNCEGQLLRELAGKNTAAFRK